MLIILFFLPDNAVNVDAVNVDAVVGAVVGVGVLFILYISGHICARIYFRNRNRKGEIYLVLRINFFDHV